MRKTAFLVALVLLLVLWAVPVYADDIPALPHAFYGTVTINGSPAPAGTSVEARGTGVTTGIEDNPIVTTEAGVYGSADAFAHRLLVQGNIEEGATITFYVNDVATGSTAAWHSGQVTQKNLAITVATQPGGGGGGGSPGILTYFFGQSGSLLTDGSGITQRPFTATSPDGMLTIDIPKGTKALDKWGSPLGSLTGEVFANPPAPPADSYIIGLAYDFGTDGATFDPPITFTWRYNPDTLPAGVAEEDLVIAYYDTTTKSWVKLTSVVDTVNHTVTAQVSHFTVYALIGTAVAATTTTTTTTTTSTTTTVTTTSTTTPTSTTTTTSTTPTKTTSSTVTTTATVTTPTTTTTPPPASTTNWGMIWGIIGGVIVVALIIVLIVRRRH